MRIADVVVGERHRRDMGDLASLATSISAIGLLHPIVVTPGNVLIAGQRRLEACRALGWDCIPATVVDLESVVRGEHDENALRKDFTPSEAVAIGRALEPLERAAAKDRQRAAGGANPGSAKFSEPPAITKVATAVGMSRPTYTKAAEVVAAAEAEPEKYAPILEQMDNTGKVDRAWKDLQRARVLERNQEIVRQAAPATAIDRRYSTVVLDPPWDWGDENDASQFGRGRPVYATMPIEQVAALPVASLAEPNAHVYLWITNRSLPKGFALLEGWGFRYVTCVTWVKPSFGMGNYFRGSTEHVLFGVRGSLPLLRSDVGTHFAAPREGQHSTKPDAFYRLVETCSPGPWLEMFARRERPGWSAWGAEL